MRDNGVVEGRDYVLDVRYADGDGVAASPGWPRMKLHKVTGKNRIMIYGPKADGTYVVEFRLLVAD